MSRDFHPDGTVQPGKNVIFVFGSNLAGRHGAGAAKVAKNMFDARYGTSAGRTGNAYAIPTKDERLRPLPVTSIRRFVHAFIDYASETPDLQFFVTRIGCGLAGYSDSEIAPLFKGAPPNCSFAEEWKPYLN